MTTTTTGPRFIASRYWSKQVPVFYVSDVKGRVGDWGYTTDYRKAIPLSKTQCDRFASDTRHCGEVARFIEV